MMKTIKYISVLLTVHNRKEKTMKCLHDLFLNELPKGYQLNVFITDDGSTDGTGYAVVNKYSDVHIIKGDGNLYWNRGMWVAWNEAAKGNPDYYLWLNDDTYVYPFMLNTLLNAAQDTNNEAIIVGSTTNAEHTRITYGGYNKNNKLIIPDGSLQQIHHFNGNIVLIPQVVYKAIGNLDWYFTHSKGDFDYGLRAGKSGIEMYQVGRYLGECENHTTIDKWCNPDVPFKERWKAMWRPNGMPPHETFHLEHRHIGLLIASFHFFTIILRCCFPKLWLKK